MAGAVAESDEMQNLGDEMQKIALAGKPAQRGGSGKMCVFDHILEQG
jgi:hypothetical protein